MNLGDIITKVNLTLEGCLMDLEQCICATLNTEVLWLLELHIRAQSSKEKIEEQKHQVG